MTVWLITGTSGAGKAEALGALESAGAECVDNLPVELLGAMAGLQDGAPVAVVVDARQGDRLARFAPVDGVQVLYLDARDDVLLRRLGESTRPHPRAAAGSGLAAVADERRVLAPLRESADVVLDTSELDPSGLAERVRGIVIGDAATPLACTVSSFGHKFGPQIEADWLIDARLVRNPFWSAELRPLTGLDPAVRDYVLADPAAQELLRTVAATFDWAAGQSRERGRRFLHIAIGCTGGRHRSVVLAEELAARLRSQGLDVAVRHRDVAKPDERPA
ncbi:MAG: RNase adapter RapZ [Candidatus Dormibacteria bacterium]